MSFLSKLFGLAKIPVLDQIGAAFDELHFSGEEKAALNLAARKLDQAGVLAQLDVQKTMLSHRSTFVAGGRPALIWMCVAGIGLQVIVRVLIQWVLQIIEWATGSPVSAPVLGALEIDQLIAIVVAALGLGALRSKDKANGVTAN